MKKGDIRALLGFCYLKNLTLPIKKKAGGTTIYIDV